MNELKYLTACVLKALSHSEQNKVNIRLGNIYWLFGHCRC